MDLTEARASLEQSLRDVRAILARFKAEREGQAAPPPTVELSAEERAIGLLIISPCAATLKAIVSNRDLEVTRACDLRVSMAASAETAHVGAKLDAALVDGLLPDWGAVKAIDWLQPLLPTECLGFFMSPTADERALGLAERAWRLVGGRGVRRLGNFEAHLDELLEAAQRRNLARIGGRLSR